MMLSPLWWNVFFWGRTYFLLPHCSSAQLLQALSFLVKAPRNLLVPLRLLAWTSLLSFWTHTHTHTRKFLFWATDAYFTSMGYTSFYRTCSNWPSPLKSTTLNIANVNSTFAVATTCCIPFLLTKATGGQISFDYSHRHTRGVMYLLPFPSLT